MAQYNPDMDESGISLGFDLLDDPGIMDLNFLGVDDLLKGSPPEMESLNFYEIQSKPAPVQSPSFKNESVNSRTQLRQQLMKDQLLKEKERRTADGVKERISTVTQRPVIPVKIQNVPLPQHVLQVTTKLQNPTKYHIREKQKNQVLQFITSSQQRETQLTGGMEALPAPAPQGMPSSSKNSSSFTIPAPAVSPSVHSVTSGGTSDAEEVIEGLLAFEESSLDAHNHSIYGSNASLESVQQKLKSESYGGYEDPTDRHKKDTHNKIERRRRCNINDKIKELGDLLPQRNEPHYDLVRDCRANKGNILKSSVDYIKILKNDIYKMKKIEVDNQQLKKDKLTLLLRIQQLEIQAQAKGVTIKEPTWKAAAPETIIEQFIREKPRARAHMPDVVSEAACVYDERMEDVPAPDPMFSTNALQPPLRHPSPLSPSLQMDTE